MEATLTQPNSRIVPRGAPETGPAEGVLLSVRDLHVEFHTSRGRVRAVEGVSYDVRPGEILAIVGESGCGKSVSSLAIMRLLPKRTSRVTKGEILFGGRDLLKLPDSEMRRIRGREIGMIFQEPMTSLNPVLTIGEQIMEPLFIHLEMSKTKARERAIELLNLVGITDPERRLEQYPHQMSGGMRQRIMIAIALACDPKLLIADEPTTALDVTIQAQILELLKDLSERLNIAVVMITHNLGIVARYAHRVNVMYAARIVEKGKSDDIFLDPKHPYTLGLMRSIPRLDRPCGDRLETIEGLPPDLRTPPEGCRFRPRCFMRIPVCENDPPLVQVAAGHLSACFRAHEVAAAESPAKIGKSEHLGDRSADRKPILDVEHLRKFFYVSRGPLIGGETTEVRAVNDISLIIRPGETLGLVGESGCGKTTIGRTILRLEDPTAGTIVFAGKDIAHASQLELRPVRRQMQVIFQDPFSSLNPRMKVGQIIAEPMLVHGIAKGKAAADARVMELLDKVGLHGFMADRYPHEMSGGQRQRVGIARALAMNPSFIVCDEPVSALDVSIQGQIINLLEDLKRELNLTYLFIAHDLAVVRHISDRVMVMYLGRLMEVADRDALYAEPLHPYTKALLDAAPVPDPVTERARMPRALKGELPSPLNPPKGCVFHTRCPLASEVCWTAVPEVREVRPNHKVACHKV
jgi:peptide/nickel transport system ATP-binding protein